MTAEVAVLNKLGVALAADSTVTITSQDGSKTYNTTNKLFTLSKYQPVGILIYRATELNSIPLEIIIKQFREYIGSKERDELAEYADAFIRYLRSHVPISRDDQIYNVDRLATQYSLILRDRYAKDCRDQQVPLAASLRKASGAKIFDDVLTRLRTQARTYGRNPGFQKLSPARVLSQYRATIEGVTKGVIDYFKPTASHVSRAALWVTEAILSNDVSSGHSGFVVAGYGRDQYYPSLISHRTDGFIANRFKMIRYRPSVIARDNAAAIVPFAQTDAAELSMEGVDPYYQTYIEESITDLLGAIPTRVERFFQITDRAKLQRFRRSLSRKAAALISDLGDRRGEWFVGKVIDAVRFLDKAELANLAESLVSLTALKQKVSLNLETVGGAIDVAVISKNDGFVWIKRKHYFEPDRNPFFFKRYLKNTT
jgi:hypothetical protein